MVSLKRGQREAHFRDSRGPWTVLLCGVQNRKPCLFRRNQRYPHERKALELTGRRDPKKECLREYPMSSTWQPPTLHTPNPVSVSCPMHSTQPAASNKVPNPRNTPTEIPWGLGGDAAFISAQSVHAADCRVCPSFMFATGTGQ